MEANYTMILAAALLLIFLLYKEIRRPNSARLYLRIIAVCAAVIALVLLVFPITYKATRKTVPAQLRLLSQGADLSHLDDQMYYTTDSAVLAARKKNIKYIPDLAYYLQANQELNTVEVAGYGLSAQELKRLKNYSFNFRPAASPAGIISCSWPAVIRKSELLRVQGIYNNTNSKAVKLILSGTGTRLDSVTIKPNTRERFTLSCNPGHTGQTVYSIVALLGTDTVEHQKIPFTIVQAPKIKLLVFSSFPDFEYKFLKNWLFDHQYQVVFRTRISKDKFSTDQLNTTINAQNLNAGTLSKFDGVIADEDELAQLNTTEAQSLQSAINNGLGLLIRATANEVHASFARQFRLSLRSDSLVKLSAPVFEDEKAALKPLPAGQFYLKPGAQQQSLVKDQTGKVLLATSLQGSGKITISTIPSTYNWMLAGLKADYAMFWSRSIGATLKKQEETLSWQTIPALPLKDHQTTFLYRATNAQTKPVISMSAQKLNPVQSYIASDAWKSTFWPEQAGWNVINVSGQQPEHLFIYKADDWKPLQQQMLLEENILFSKNHKFNLQNNQLEAEFYEKELSVWWFFAVFLISITYIWFETKLL